MTRLRLPPRLLYRLFPLAGLTSYWVEQRFGAAGRLALAALVCGILFGIDIRQTQAYQLAALGFALLACGIALSLYWRPRLSIRRVLPDVVTSHTTSRYFIEITNHGARPERDLVVQDCLRRRRLPYDDFQRQRGHGGGRNWFDRTIGFPRWVELSRRLRGASLELVEVPIIAPGASVRVAVDLTPHRRGWLHFAEVRLLRPDPLGVFRARRRFPAPASLLSLPRRYAAPAFHLTSHRQYQRGGISLAQAVGDSQEFASLRDYRPGDPRRHIHWRTYARTGTLVIKEFQDEYFDRHALVVDTHHGDEDREGFEAVIAVAASIAGGERPRDAILDVIFAGTEVIQLSAGRGLGDTSRALTYLAEAQPSPPGDFEQLAELMRGRAGAMASVIMVTAAEDGARAALLDELVTHEVRCVRLQIGPAGETPLLPRMDGEVQRFVIRADHVADDLARVDVS